MNICIDVTVEIRQSLPFVDRSVFVVAYVYVLNYTYEKRSKNQNPYNKMTVINQKNTDQATRIQRVKLIILLIINTAVAAQGGGTPPAVLDCSTLALNMADCLSFLTTGSTVQTPQGACCDGLKLELKVDASCLCDTFKNSQQLGITLNITKAVGLPAACNVSAPAVSDCGLNYNVVRGPAVSPSASPPKTRTVGPSTGGVVPPLPSPPPPPPPATSSSSALPPSTGPYSFLLLLLLAVTLLFFL